MNNLCLVLTCLICASAESVTPHPPRALLIGCTRYDNLPRSKDLAGPENDVALLRRVLTNPPYRFPDANVMTLSETAGRDHPERRPTRANIEREVRRLAEAAGPGQQVLVAFCGHGSQQPDCDPPDPADPEPDGLDEILLPADAGPWDTRTRAVANAIVDDELGAWLKPIADRGAAVCLIVDACHSGTVVRGVVRERDRKVSPRELGIPREAMEKAAERADRANEGTPLGVADAVPNLVAIYAGLATEPTPELPPPDGGDPRPLGLLTYTLCRELTRARGPISWAGLVDRIRNRYAAWGRLYPTPLVEGLRRDEGVLGTDVRAERDVVRLRREADAWMIDAGALQGFTEGSVLAVLPPPGDPDPDRVVGHARVKGGGVGTYRAEVQPCRLDGAPDPDVALPDGGHCRPLFLDFGALRVGVAVEDPGSHIAARALAERVRRKLDQIAGERGAPVTVRDHPGSGDWVVCFERDDAGLPRAYLSPAAGWVARSEAEPSPLFGPLPADDSLGAWLTERLRRISRTRNLVRICGDARAGLSGAELGLVVELVKYRDAADRDGTVVRPGPGGIVLKEGEVIGFRLQNKGAAPLDVTLLFVDSGAGIRAYYPRSGTVLDNRLPPGATAVPLCWSGTEWRQCRSRVTRSTLGLEHMAVVAVTARGSPVDFSCLEQSTLEQARQAGGERGAAALRSPLGDLLSHALYGATRGALADEEEEMVLGLISWQVFDTIK